MATAEQVQSLIDASMAEYEKRQQAVISTFIQTKLDEHEEKVGTFVKNGGTMLERLGQGQMFLTQAGADAQQRADRIISEMNAKAKEVQDMKEELKSYVENLEQKTSSTIYNTIEKFNADGVVAKEEVEGIKRAMESVATDGANRLDKTNQEIVKMYAWSVEFQNEVKEKVWSCGKRRCNKVRHREGRQVEQVGQEGDRGRQGAGRGEQGGMETLDSRSGPTT